MQQTILQGILEYARSEGDIACWALQKATNYNDEIVQYDKIQGGK